MKFHRQDRLWQVHIIISIQKRIGGGVGHILSCVGFSADDQILGDRPASVSYIVEHQQMLQKRGCHIPPGIFRLTVWFEDAVRVSHGKCIWIRGLFQAHYLPHQNE